jgi:hypothetical protein
VSSGKTEKRDEEAQSKRVKEFMNAPGDRVQGASALILLNPYTLSSSRDG